MQAGPSRIWVHVKVYYLVLQLKSFNCTTAVSQYLFFYYWPIQTEIWQVTSFSPKEKSSIFHSNDHTDNLNEGKLCFQAKHSQKYFKM